jgi:signal transduction histidine kinase
VVAGLIGALALNLHFALTVVRKEHTARLARLGYAACAIALVANFTPYWRDSAAVSLREYTVLGYPLLQVNMPLGVAAFAFYALALAVLGGVLALFAAGYRRGRGELLPALIGAAGIPLAALNDLLLAAGVPLDTVFVLPAAYSAYCFAIAVSLLVRYRDALAELQQARGNLARRTEDLRKSYHDLQLMEDELGKRQQLAAVGELAASIAHEVRNPLAVISNSVAGLRRPGIHEEDRSTLLQIVEEEVARLNRLVTDLLRFARPVSISTSRVSLRELAEQTRTMVGPRHAVDVSVPEDPAAETVHVDAGLLRLVLENLVENACQAMPEGGQLSVRVQSERLEEAPAVALELTDSGHGMEARILERAKKPFFTTRPTGTGLGLPIVERIIHAHGGRMLISSAPGQGTTVRLVLPVGKPLRRITLDGLRSSDPLPRSLE